MRPVPPARSHRFGTGRPEPHRLRVVGGTAIIYGCLAALYFLGRWIYTGPEFVHCPVVNQTCYAPLTQLEVPIFTPLEIAPLALATLYGLVPLLDPRRTYRQIGALAVTAVAVAAAIRVFTPTPTVDVDAGGFILPFPSLYAAGATAVLGLAAAVVVRGIYPRSPTPDKTRARPKSPSEELSDILRENAAAERRGAVEERNGS